LGIPYVSAEDALTLADVYACCGHEPMRTEMMIRPTAMGADIGKRYHTVVIGEKVSEKKSRIIYMCRVKGFDELYKLCKKYNVKSAVIDRRPYEESFEKFKERAENLKQGVDGSGVTVYGAEYKDKQKNFVKTDEHIGTYSLSRTIMFDKTHNWVKSGLLEIPSRSREVEEYARQMCNCAKVLEEDEQTGDRIYRYQRTGDGEDHYRSATNYLYMALQVLDYEQGMQAAGYGRGESHDWNPMAEFITV
jgi:hypothetical protein